MLGIPDDDQRREIAEDIAHQQVLSAERMSYKHKDMARLLQRDWQSVGMAKETMTNQSYKIWPSRFLLENWSQPSIIQLVECTLKLQYRLAAYRFLV